MRPTSQMREEDLVNDVDVRKPIKHFPLNLRFGRHLHGASNIVERCIDPLLVLHQGRQGICCHGKPLARC